MVRVELLPTVHQRRRAAGREQLGELLGVLEVRAGVTVPSAHCESHTAPAPEHAPADAATPAGIAAAAGGPPRIDVWRRELIWRGPDGRAVVARLLAWSDTTRPIMKHEFWSVWCRQNGTMYLSTRIPCTGGHLLNEDMLNMSVRKFLKKVGVTSQREIEEAVRLAVSSGRLKGNEVLPAKVKLTVGGIDLSLEIEASVELE